MRSTTKRRAAASLANDRIKRHMEERFNEFDNDRKLWLNNTSKTWKATGGVQPSLHNENKKSITTSSSCQKSVKIWALSDTVVQDDDTTHGREETYLFSTPIYERKRRKEGGRATDMAVCIVQRPDFSPLEVIEFEHTT